MRLILFAAISLLYACSSVIRSDVAARRFGDVYVLMRPGAPDRLVDTNGIEYRVSFRKAGGCLVLLSDGAEYTPIFYDEAAVRRVLGDLSFTARSRNWSVAGGPIAE